MHAYKKYDLLNPRFLNLGFRLTGSRLARVHVLVTMGMGPCACHHGDGSITLWFVHLTP